MLRTTPEDGCPIYTHSSISKAWKQELKTVKMKIYSERKMIQKALAYLGHANIEQLIIRVGAKEDGDGVSRRSYRYDTLEMLIMITRGGNRESTTLLNNQIG